MTSTGLGRYLAISWMPVCILLTLASPLKALPPDSYLDTLYIQDAQVPLYQADPGDTLWVGVGLVNTFTVGGVVFRLELPDTNLLVPATTPDTVPGFLKVVTRLTGRGTTFNTPHAIGASRIKLIEDPGAIIGVLVDFQLSANLPAGRGTIIEMAFVAKPGLHLGQSITLALRDKPADPAAPRNQLSDASGSQTVFPRLSDGTLHLVANSVLIDVTTNTGNDTLFVGHPGSIIFSLDANGNQVQGVEWLYFLNFTGGNWVGALSDATDGDPLNNVVPSPLAVSTFATLAFNSPMGANPTSPDTMLYGMVSFGGPFAGSGELFRLNVTPTGAGTLSFQPAKAPDFLTGDAFDVSDPNGASLPVAVTTETFWSVPKPVLIDVSTSTGNDTLFVGKPGSIIFSLDANGYQVQGVVWMYFLNFAADNWMGVLSYSDDGDPINNVVASPAAVSAFTTIAFSSPLGQNPTNPDSLLFGMVSFGGPFLGSGELFRLNVTPSGPGTLHLVPVESPNFIPPGSTFGVQDPHGADLPDDSKTETFWAVQSIQAKVIASCPEVTRVGGNVAFHIGAAELLGTLVSLDFVNVRKFGVPIATVNPPQTIGLGGVDAPHASELITSWMPSPIDNGTYEFCFAATDDLGGSDTVFDSVVVLPQGPDHAFWNPPFHYEFTPGTPVPASLSWSLTHTAPVQGVIGPFVLSSVSGGAFFDSPIIGDGMMSADVTPGTDFLGFASKSDNTFANDAVSPDTVLGGLISFAAAIPSPGTSTVFSMAAMLADAEGIIRINQPRPPGFVDNFLSYNDPNGGTIIPTYSPGCFVVTQVHNVPPTVQCPVSCNPGVGPIIFGDPVSVPGFSYTDPDAAPGPYTFSVVSMTKDGNPAVPHNAPSFAGDTFNWQTSNADNGDVGVWQFCVQVNDGNANSTNTCCFCVTVIAQVPVVCFEFGCVEDVLTGSTVCVPLTINNIDPCLLLGGFDLLFQYDASLLTFQGLDLTGSVLSAAGWEYLTYRIVSTNPALIRIVAIADMNNSNHHPNTLCLDGLIANVCFRVTSDQNAGCQSAHIKWFWYDCGDNTASDPTGNILYIITDPNGPVPYAGGDPAQGIPGGGIIMNSCGIEGQLATFEGGASGPDLFPCPNPNPNKPNPVQALCFINGKLKIICPGDIDDRGDINLNALAYEIADAVLYSDYFISGPSVFTINIAGQTAASDVNADGTPLTVADLVYLIRVITGDALPISGDLLGGGPKVAGVAGTLGVTSEKSDLGLSVSTKSDCDLGAILLRFNTHGTRITGVNLALRAQAMDVIYAVQGDELRVLVYNIADKARIEAGSGQLLTVTTEGPPCCELVDLEAATFMGGQLDVTLEAKVLPTQFALKQNFPNPFNPSTSLAINFPTASEYKLTIYNIAGQTVRSFAGNTEAGTLHLTWDGRDARGSSVATGVYFYSVEAGSFKDVKKMVLLK